MKRYLHLVLVLVLVMLSGCAAEGEGATDIPEGHTHKPPAAENILEHEIQGYCGNTVTTVRCEITGAEEQRWERSFWGGLSVELTDFLRWLDYRQGICRCRPEYYVKTELSACEYGVDLTQGYVRCGEKQVTLTNEQVNYLCEIMDRIVSGEGIAAELPGE